MTHPRQFLAALALPLLLSATALPPVALESNTIRALDISSAPVGQNRVVDPVLATAEIMIDPSRSHSVTSFFSGQIHHDLVQLGAEVTADQPLATLRSIELAETLSRWLEADRLLPTATARFQRESNLRTEQLTTEDEFLAAQSAFQEASAKRTAALQKALLARSRDELETLSTADEFGDLSTLTLTAPIEGMVIHKSAYAGDPVEPNRRLFEIADLDQLRVAIQVPLKTAHFLKPGDAIEFHTVVGAHRTGTAHIQRILPIAAQGALVVPVFATLDNTERNWLAGTPVNVELVDSAAPKVTAVPSSAVVTIKGSPHLFLAQSGGRFQPVAITPGASSQAFTEVTSELPRDARVVVSGANLLLAAWEDRIGGS